MLPSSREGCAAVVVGACAAAIVAVARRRGAGKNDSVDNTSKRPPMLATVVNKALAQAKEADLEATAQTLHAALVAGRWAKAKAGALSTEGVNPLSKSWELALLQAENAVERAKAAHAEAHELEPDWLQEASLLLESLHDEAALVQQPSSPFLGVDLPSDAQIQQLQAELRSARTAAEEARAARDAAVLALTKARRPSSQIPDMAAVLVIVLAAKELLRPRVP